ncbi:MAG: hypothetical protein A4S12_06140 [Proteobacteria bacterium SG_bin5]|nr:hypothetical protein [Sphingomonas sp.]OQW43045.1 MAG: hypothetical protein A4S12_06140 [Proteobacteria bacterium SG_bin5]
MTLLADLAVPSRPLPRDEGGRLLLASLRKMRWNGVEDAALAQRFVTLFGRDFRRVLFVTRMLAEQLNEAPSVKFGTCRRTRMTESEAMLIAIAARLPGNVPAARLLLADLLGTRAIDAMLAALFAVSEAFAAMGKPIGG